MKVLFLASEAVPFVKTGGLADVAGSLPDILNDMKADVRVVLPLYRQISSEYRDQMKKIAEFYVDLDWRHQYVGVFEYQYHKTTYYFLDNEYYFDRMGLYGDMDDGERFAFFSKACTILPKIIGFHPDIIHANDWHTALAVVLVKDFAKGDPFYQSIKTLLTIHNLKYQGIFPAELLGLIGLSPYYFNEDALKYYDAINLLKGGIIFSDAFNTVSGTYALEIKSPFFGEGLDGVIRDNEHKLSGIVNGIDYKIWNPKTDDLIAYRYDLATISEREKNKTYLQRLYHLPERNVPMIGIVSRLVDMKGLDLVRFILEELLQEDIQVVVLGTGEDTYEEMFRYFEWKYPHKLTARIYYNNTQAHQIYAGTDFLLMPSVSEPCGISQLIAMRYGNVPIVREAGGLKDTVHPYSEFDNTGTGFTFSNINAHDLLYTIRHAIHFYHQPEHFNQIIENGMKIDNTWKKSAEKYFELYRRIM